MARKSCRTRKFGMVEVAADRGAAAAVAARRLQFFFRRSINFADGDCLI